jgi:hypothetical protein
MHESEHSAGLSPDQTTALYAPGTHVRITQQIPRRTDTYTTTILGTVLRHERQSSGSWFARNPSGRLWLDRLIIQKPDGEISTLNLDEYTRVEVLDGPPATDAESPLVQPSQDPAAGIT